MSLKINIGSVQKWFVLTILTTTAVKIYRFINQTGTYPAAAAVCDGGVTQLEIATNYDADIVACGIVPVYCEDTVTVGQYVEISGTAGGVKNFVAGAKVGKAMSSGAAGDLALIWIL